MYDYLLLVFFLKQKVYLSKLKYSEDLKANITREIHPIKNEKP